MDQHRIGITIKRQKTFLRRISNDSNDILLCINTSGIPGKFRAKVLILVSGIIPRSSLIKFDCIRNCPHPTDNQRGYQTGIVGVSRNIGELWQT